MSAAIPNIKKIYSKKSNSSVTFQNPQTSLSAWSDAILSKNICFSLWFGQNDPLTRKNKTKKQQLVANIF